MVLVSAMSARADGCVGFIGDSVTYGSGATVPSGQGPGTPGATDAVGWVKYWLERVTVASGKRIGVDNRAVAGATTADWAVPNAGYYFNAVSGWPHMGTGFQASHCSVIMVMLGVNDSRDNFAFSPAKYAENLRALAANVKHDMPGAKLILNAPIWYDGARAAGTIGSGYSPAAAGRLDGYIAALRQLADNKTVFLGDVEAYERFKAAARTGGPLPLQGPDGLHPTDAGYRVLGRLWFDALRKVLDLPEPQPLH